MNVLREPPTVRRHVPTPSAHSSARVRTDTNSALTRKLAKVSLQIAAILSAEH